MHPLQQTIIEVAIPTATVNNGAFTSNVIDTQDYEDCGYLEFIVILGTMDIALTVLKVMESEVKTDPTTLGGTPALTVDSPSLPAATNDNTIAVFGINLKDAHARYLQLQGTAGNGTNGVSLTAIAQGRGTIGDSNASARGLLFAAYA